MQKGGVSLPFVSVGFFLLRQDPEAVLHFFLTADHSREGEKRWHQQCHGFVNRQNGGSVRQDSPYGRLRGWTCLGYWGLLVYYKGGSALGCPDVTLTCQCFQNIPGCAHSHMIYFTELTHGRQGASVWEKPCFNLFFQALI